MVGTVVGYNNAGADMMMQANGGCSACGNQTGGKAKKERKPRKPTEYNKFVKKEMNDLMKKNPSKKVTELMKEVAKKWQEHKAAKASKGSKAR